MSFDPYTFIELSEKLYYDGGYHQEAKFRTSVSRAYYAAFLVSRNFLMDNGCTFSKSGEEHKEVILFMKKYSKYISDDLRELRDERNDADYDLSFNQDDQSTRRSIQNAKEIIFKVKNEEFWEDELYNDEVKYDNKMEMKSKHSSKKRKR